MDKSVFRRLEELEKEYAIGACGGRLAELIASAAYYDDLTDDNKNAYCDYYGYERGVMENLSYAVMGNLHFQLRRKPKLPTDAEFRENVREVERIMDEIIGEYNAKKQGEAL